MADPHITLELAVLRLVEQHNRTAREEDLASFANPAAIFWRIQYTAPHLWTADEEQMLLRVNYAMRAMAQKRELDRRSPSTGPPLSTGYALTEIGRNRIRGFELP